MRYLRNPVVLVIRSNRNHCRRTALQGYCSRLQCYVSYSISGKSYSLSFIHLILYLCTRAIQRRPYTSSKTNGKFNTRQYGVNPTIWPTWIQVPVMSLLWATSNHLSYISVASRFNNKIDRNTTP